MTETVKGGLAYAGYYIPEESLSISDLVTRLSTGTLPADFQEPEDFLDFAGGVLNLDAIRICTQTDELSMATKMMDKLLEEHPFDSTGIRLILTTFEPGRGPRPNLGHYVQGRYGMSNATVLNISGNHCANLDVAFDAACRHYIAGNGDVLVLNAVKALHHDQRIIGSYGVLGDGAGAFLFSDSEPIIERIDHLLLCNGALYAADMRMDATMIHLKYLVKGIRELLHRNDVQPSAIASILVQNANPLLVTQAVLAAGLDPEKIYTGNFGRYGHLDSLDFLVNLHTVLNDNAAIPSSQDGTGKLVLSIGLGWAGSYAFTLLKTK